MATTTSAQSTPALSTSKMAQVRLSKMAVDALFDAAEQQAGTGAGLAGAVRGRVLREMVVRVAMREDLDRQTAERLVAEQVALGRQQVALGRQQGHVTVPEVAEAVMLAIEELKGCSLAGGEMERWLYGWEYAAAHPDHGLDRIDFA